MKCMIGRIDLGVLGSRYPRLGSKSSLTGLRLLSPEVISYYNTILKGFKKIGFKKRHNWDLLIRIRK